MPVSSNAGGVIVDLYNQYCKCIARCSTKSYVVRMIKLFLRVKVSLRCVRIGSFIQSSDHTESLD